MHKNFIYLAVFLLLGLMPAQAQTSGDTTRYSLALPSLRITPDARFSGMCNVGIAMPADPNSMHFNPSNIVFSQQKFNFGLSYAPNFASPQEFINYFSLFGKLGKKNALGASVRFAADSMSVDTASARQQGANYVQKQLNRNMELGFALAHKFGEGFSVAVSGKYIMSSFASWKDSTGTAILSPSAAFAADVSATYQRQFKIGTPHEGLETNGAFRAALSITNIGTRLEYGANGINAKTFQANLPTNMGLGLGFTYNVNKNLAFSVGGDFNKLLVAQISSADVNGDSIPDYQQMDAFKAMLSSLQDSPEGIMGELKTMVYSIGTEFMYKKRLSFRLGHQGKDYIQQLENRLAAGFGLHVSVFTINASFAREIGTSHTRGGNVNLSVLIDLSNLGRKKDKS